ncbi:metallophosphoesterase [Caldibacillus thermolactis]|jgi:uncharacterized protein|uniref:Phosphoesterase n=1 Tax=Pallidibacillus thermolactis TaxID=251051 RepID=A0ABT2WG28_9BACI|nr:metallophosphoesterase [Pallidibacillus thermolactis]MCU9594652.1 metallophosphoesterase [Pallidibacillus thermolactis]
MKILICSDSHGLTDELIELKKRHGDMDYYIHCGDSELTGDHPALDGYRVVKGNCDFGSDFPEQLMLRAEDHTILVTHGHRYQVKSNLINLRYKALEENANIVCFGHSHMLGFEMVDDILFINPGSLRLPRGRSEKTYIILEIVGKKKILHVYDVNHNQLFSETLE